MTETWIIVGVVAIATVLFKAAGPVFLGGRELPERMRSVVDLLAPVLLTALVVTQTFGGDGEVALDARVPGVAAGAIAVWRRVPRLASPLMCAQTEGEASLAPTRCGRYA